VLKFLSKLYVNNYRFPRNTNASENQGSVGERRMVRYRVSFLYNVMHEKISTTGSENRAYEYYCPQEFFCILEFPVNIYTSHNHGYLSIRVSEKTTDNNYPVINKFNEIPAEGYYVHAEREIVLSRQLYIGNIYVNYIYKSTIVTNASATSWNHADISIGVSEGSGPSFPFPKTKPKIPVEGNFTCTQRKIVWLQQL